MPRTPRTPAKPAREWAPGSSEKKLLEAVTKDPNLLGNRAALAEAAGLHSNTVYRKFKNEHFKAWWGRCLQLIVAELEMPILLRVAKIIEDPKAKDQDRIRAAEAFLRWRPKDVEHEASAAFVELIHRFKAQPGAVSVTMLHAEMGAPGQGSDNDSYVAPDGEPGMGMAAPTGAMDYPKVGPVPHPTRPGAARAADRIVATALEEAAADRLITVEATDARDPALVEPPSAMPPAPSLATGGGVAESLGIGEVLNGPAPHDESADPKDGVPKRRNMGGLAEADRVLDRLSRRVGE